MIFVSLEQTMNKSGHIRSNRLITHLTLETFRYVHKVVNLYWTLDFSSFSQGEGIESLEIDSQLE